MGELILTGATIACVIGLQIVSRVLKRPDDTIFDLLINAIAIAILIWVPSYVRSLLIGGFGVWAVWIAERDRRITLVLLAVVAAVTLWLPGGVSAVLCGILAFMAIGQLRDARIHLIRLARARALVANQPVSEEVELAGTAHAVTPTVDPIYGGPCALWRVTGLEGMRQSDVMIEIRGANGSALADPTAIWVELRPPRRVTGEEAKRAAELLRLELMRDGDLQLHVVAEGTECYVLGVPTWEPAPSSSVGPYRDQAMLPTFRSTPEVRALFADRSEAELRGDHAWAMASWGTWGTLCAAITVAQLFGWA